MLIYKYINIEKEIGIDLSVEDLALLLDEAEIDNAKHKRVVLMLISKAIHVLENTPEKWMAEFNKTHSDIVLKKLEDIKVKWEKVK